MITILLSIAGIMLGGFIGFSFGTLQNNAQRKYNEKQNSGKFNSGWSVIPGSMRRTAYLLMLLAGIQVLCPFFFDAGNVQWLISAGVVIGYGWTLFMQLRGTTISHA